MGRSNGKQEVNLKKITHYDIIIIGDTVIPLTYGIPFFKKERNNMKQAWNDLKSFITILFAITIVGLIFILALKGNWDVFQIVFTLFSNLATAVFTYFFTKQTKQKNEGITEEIK